MKIDSKFSEISAFIAEKTNICSILKVNEISWRKLSNNQFSENNFPNIRKQLGKIRVRKNPFY